MQPPTLAVRFVVSDRLRRAINFHYGKPGKASRKEVKSWLWRYGHSRDDEILSDLYLEEEKNQAVQ